TSLEKYSSSIKLLHVPFISLNVGPANNSGVSVLTFSRFIIKAEKSNVVCVGRIHEQQVQTCSMHDQEKVVVWVVETSQEDDGPLLPLAGASKTSVDCIVSSTGADWLADCL
ncbi:hypothetical protein Tco_0274437, partial [Tanacetum coccineum]